MKKLGEWIAWGPVSPYIVYFKIRHPLVQKALGRQTRRDQPTPWERDVEKSVEPSGKQLVYFSNGMSLMLPDISSFDLTTEPTVAFQLRRPLLGQINNNVTHQQHLRNISE